MSLRIAINAQLIPTAGAGGTQTVLIGLVHALGELDGPEEYVLIAPWKEKEPDWLKPFVGKNQSIVRGPKMQAVKRIVIHTENTIRRPPRIIHMSTHSRRPAGNRFSCVRKAKSLVGNRFSRAGKAKSLAGNRFSCAGKVKSHIGRFSYVGKVKSHTGNRFSYMGKAKSLAGNRFSRAGKVKSHTGNRFSRAGKAKSRTGNRFSRAGKAKFHAGNPFSCVSSLAIPSPSTALMPRAKVSPR